MAEYGVSSALLDDGCNWKSTGCAQIDGVLYWAISRHNYGQTSGDPLKRQTAKNGSIIKSADGGKSWTRSAAENYSRPMFPGSRFATPYFIQYGKGEPPSVDGSDRYVYAISNNGFWDNGDDVVLGRVLRTRFANLNPADWEYYKGGDGARPAAWSGEMTSARPIVEAKNHLGMSGAVYVPAMRRYFMVGWYYPKGGGKLPDAHAETIWDFYESPKPWGPWTKVGSHRWFPQGYYCPTVCLKYMSNRGRRLFAITAGDWTNHSVYRFTLVPLDLE
jgi:hypothetical protein